MIKSVHVLVLSELIIPLWYCFIHFFNMIMYIKVVNKAKFTLVILILNRTYFYQMNFHLF